MNHSIRTGLSFGLTSGIITTLGLMIGLAAGTHSSIAVLGGIFTIAVADAFSDALGMHISSEAKKKHSLRGIWEATLSTFGAKLVIALTFAVPVILLGLDNAVIASIVWGITALGVLSYFVAKQEKEDPLHVIAEHLLIAIVVILATNWVGSTVSVVFS
jgi:VIT1/CCC1 family predicted Fe2+/Mn2+ transporter